MSLRHRNLGPIGVDIGASGLKMLQCERCDDRPVVIAAAYHALPAGLSAEQRLNSAFAALTSALATRRFHGRRITTALSPREFQIKSLRLPRLPAEELAAAVAFEAQERFALGEDGGEYRHLTAGDVRQGTEIREELIVFGAPNHLIQERLNRLCALHLSPQAIDAAPCAMARAFSRFLRREEDAAAVNVFVDVGRSGSCVVLTRGPHVVFVKPVEVGGAMFDDAVAQRFNMTPEAAHDVRLSAMHHGPCGDEPAQSERIVSGGDDGQTSSTLVRDELIEALRAPVEQLGKEVQLCLRYFAVTFRGQRPDTVTLVGGEAAEPALRAWIPTILDLECVVGDPFRGMHVAVPDGLPEGPAFRPAWSVAVGLALRDARPARKAGAAA